MSHKSSRPKPRSAVLINRDGCLLALERRKTGRPLYYSLPGGGVEKGETPEQAAMRELQEELGATIEVLGIVLDPLQTERETYVIKANLVSPHEVSWQEPPKPGNGYRPVWLPLDQVADVELYPRGTKILVV